MSDISPRSWGIPVVRSSTERDSTFPTPATNQRVHNLATRSIERWDGTQWVVENFSPNVDVRSFGAVGDGVTDDTANITAAFAAGAGYSITVPLGYVFLVSASIPLASGTHYSGGGCFKLKAGTDLGFGVDGLGKGLLHGINCVGTFVENIEVDGNADAANGTKCHAITFNDGEWNTVERCHVHDTYHAGIEGIDQTSFQVIDNDVRDCGRGGTNDHGIMIVAFTTDMTDTVIKLNRVDGTHRKGIASYAQAPGYFRGVDCSLNTVTNSGLGDIYLGAVPGTWLDYLTCIGNTCNGSPVNMELDHVRYATVGMNTLSDTSNDCNIHMYGCQFVIVSSNMLDKAFFHAIMMNVGLGGDGCTGCKIIGNIITRPNQGAYGTGAGIAMETSTGNMITGNSITDADTNLIYCILEDAGCDHNVIEDNPILEDFASARVLVTGANTRYSADTGLFRGIGTIAPAVPLDIAKETRFQGAVTAVPIALILTTGTNNNVAITAVGKVYVPTTLAGPLGGDFTITGIASGTEGREIELFNASTHNMTIKHQSASSDLGKRVSIGGSADLVISANGSVTLRYFTSAYGADGAWAVKGYKA